MSNKNSLTIWQINAHNSHNVHSFLENYLTHDCDIIAAQEIAYSHSTNTVHTKLSTMNINSSIQPRCSTLFHSSLPHFIPYAPTQYVTVCDVYLSNCPIRIINCYLPPVGSGYVDTVEKSLDIISLFVSNWSNPLLLVGDLNARSTEWGDRLENVRGLEILEFFGEHDLKVINNKSMGPTFCSATGSSWVDVAAANSNLLKIFEINWKILDHIEVLSDHRLIEIQITAKTSHHCFSSQQPSLMQSPLDLLKYRSQLLDLNNSNIDSRKANDFLNSNAFISADYNNPNLYAIELLNFIHSFMLFSCKPKGKPKFHNFWFNETLAKMKANLARLRRAASNTQSSHLFSLITVKQKEYRLEIRRAKEHSWNLLLERVRSYYDVPFKVHFNKISRRSPVFALEDGLCLNQNCAKILDHFYKSDCLDESSANKLIRTQSAFPTLKQNYDFNEISASDVYAILNSMNPRKAPGPDLVSTKVLRMVHQIRPEIITDFVNYCFKTRTFPLILKTSSVITIPKKGNCSNLSNLRPISLLPILGKLIERIIFSHLMPLLLERGFGKHQFGFMKGRSTVDAISTAVARSNELVSKGRKVVWISIDFKSAFDLAWWPAVLVSLRRYGIGGVLYEMIKSFLSDRCATVQLYGGTRAAKWLERSCPQGSILGPLLWNLILDEFLQTNCSYVDKVAYADDCLLIVNGSSWSSLLRSCEGVLSQLCSWSSSVKLEVSVNKTFVIPIRCRPPPDFCLRYNDAPLSLVYSLKYLGVLIDSGLRYKDHIRNLLRTSVSLAQKFARLGNTLRGYSPEMRRRTYQAVILPKLTYAYQVWEHALAKQSYCNLLLSAQRPIVKRIALCWRPVGLSSACVIAGVLPINIEVRRMAVTKRCINDLEFFKNYVQENNLTFTSNFSHKNIKSFIKTSFFNFFCDDVGDKRIHLLIENEQDFQNFWKSGFNSTTIQLATGVGRFAEFMKRIGVTDSDACELCSGHVQTADHLLFNCPAVQHLRSNDWPLTLSEMKNNLELLVKFSAQLSPLLK